MYHNLKKKVQQENKKEFFIVFLPQEMQIA